MTMPRLIETEDSIAKEIPKTLLTFLGVECLSHCCIVLHRTLASSVLLHIQQQPLDLQDHEVPGIAGSTAWIYCCLTCLILLDASLAFCMHND